MSKFTKLLITLLFIFLIEIILIYRGCKINMQISDTLGFKQYNVKNILLVIKDASSSGEYKNINW